ncbi:MAG TPA: hypothetical protein VD861_15445 [Pyrinomonadaceae bacterium]|nr:hypothetical protein [Pyrinomonadaceae bacterium]
MKTFALSLLLTLCCFGAAAAQKVDLEKERAALLEVHRTDRRAHFETDADLLLKHSAEEFIYVGNGKISRSTRAGMRAEFEDYFKDAKYYEWDDLEPPIVRISDDASMAWMIVRTKVRRTQKQAGGEEKERSFVYAGIMTYEKQKGKWVRIANVSTFE